MARRLTSLQWNFKVGGCNHCKGKSQSSPSPRELKDMVITTPQWIVTDLDKLEGKMLQHQVRRHSPIVEHSIVEFTKIVARWINTFGHDAPLLIKSDSVGLWKTKHQIVKPTITKEIEMDTGKPVVEPRERIRYNVSKLHEKNSLCLYQEQLSLSRLTVYPWVLNYSRRHEDVIEIILNLKRFCCKNGDEEKRAIINAVGAREVTAAGYHRWFRYVRFSIQIYIATLAENATYNGEEHRLGRGYVLQSRITHKDLPYSSYSRLNIHTC